MRGKGVFSKVMNSVSLLKKYGMDKISMSMTLGAKNAHLEEGFKELNNELGTYPLIRGFSAIGRGEECEEIFCHGGQLYVPPNICNEKFGICFLVLTWMILFKMSFLFGFSLDAIHCNRSINLIPYHASVIANGRLDIKEIIYNMIGFIPFGIYVCMITDNWSILKKIISIAGVSLLYEVLQFIFAIGASDITDLINNTLGGIIGIAIYFFISKLFKSNQKMNKVLNTIALILTILIIVFLTFITVMNLLH